MDGERGKLKKEKEERGKLRAEEIQQEELSRSPRTQAESRTWWHMFITPGWVRQGQGLAIQADLIAKSRVLGKDLV